MAVCKLPVWEKPLHAKYRFEKKRCAEIAGKDEKSTFQHVRRNSVMGRLAVCKDFQGRGLGSILPARALSKAYENAAVVGSSMVVVDAIDERAARFYQAHGFIQVPESMRLVLPMRTMAGLIPGGTG
jgi:GNAT superfamily N-acetyltransferase